MEHLAWAEVLGATRAEYQGHEVGEVHEFDRKDCIGRVSTTLSSIAQLGYEMISQALLSDKVVVGDEDRFVDQAPGARHRDLHWAISPKLIKEHGNKLYERYMEDGRIITDAPLPLEVGMCASINSKKLANPIRNGFRVDFEHLDKTAGHKHIQRPVFCRGAGGPAITQKYIDLNRAARAGVPAKAWRRNNTG